MERSSTSYDYGSSHRYVYESSDPYGFREELVNAFGDLSLNPGASTSTQPAEDVSTYRYLSDAPANTFSSSYNWYDHDATYSGDDAENEARSQFNTGLWLNIKERLGLASFVDKPMSITLEWLSREPVPGTFNLITDEAIDAASSQPTPSTHGRGAEGSGNGEDGDDIHAIGTLLSACLRAHSDADDPLRAAAVQQAACQIILRLPEEDSSYTLCWSTLKTALENAGASLAREKTPHPCKEPGCQKAFSRGADLQRHAKIIHQPESDRKQYVCDYKRCPRHKSPFFRMDHFKDHLRDDHKEDLTRRGVKPDEKWWAGRSRTSTEKGWFRCSKCLVQRVDVEEYGYTCPGCGHTCEADRQKYRKRLGQELPAGW